MIAGGELDGRRVDAALERHLLGGRIPGVEVTGDIDFLALLGMVSERRGLRGFLLRRARLGAAGLGLGGLRRDNFLLGGLLCDLNIHVCGPY